ncbi:branched chain amino acid ABC transporter substrate-binding protein [Bacteroidia bacterium]|nr:branched chain amino acid ABC transporter substrate-binding protein [Bacteroidia bacterium]
MNKKIFITIGVIAVIAIGVFVWLNKNKDKQDEIKIGVILPLTGELANFGNTVLDGINMKLSETNDKNYTIKLIVEDSKGQPNLSVNCFNKLIDIDKVNCIIGDLTSGATLAIAPESNKKQVVIISPTASTPALTKISPFFYRVYPSDLSDAKIAAYYCYDNFKAKNISIVYLNNDYSVGLKNEFSTSFSTLGGKINNVISYESNTKDFRTTISKLKMINDDVIYIIGHPIGIANFLKQSKELQFTKHFFSNVAAEDREFLITAGESANNLYFTAPAFNLQAKDENTQNFIKQFNKRYSYTPDIHAVKGYDIMTILMDCLDNGCISSLAIKHHIDKKQFFNGICGQYKFINGDIEEPVSVKKYNNTNIEIVEIIEPL